MDSGFGERGGSEGVVPETYSDQTVGRDDGSRQIHMHPSHRWGKLRPGLSHSGNGKSWEAMAGLLMHSLRLSNCCADR